MTILFNADNNLTVHEGFRNKLKDHLLDELERFSDRITRVEAHLSDDNGHKYGDADKNCLLEVRIEGRQPIAVKAGAGSYEVAVQRAIDKLKSSLDTIFSRMKEH